MTLDTRFSCEEKTTLNVLQEPGPPGRIRQQEDHGCLARLFLSVGVSDQLQRAVIPMETGHLGVGWDALGPPSSPPGLCSVRHSEELPLLTF